MISLDSVIIILVDLKELFFALVRSTFLFFLHLVAVSQNLFSFIFLRMIDFVF